MKNIEDPLPGFVIKIHIKAFSGKRFKNYELSTVSLLHMFLSVEDSRPTVKSLQFLGIFTRERFHIYFYHH